MSSCLFLPPPPASSVPDFEEAVPGTSGHSHPISCDPQAADPVVVAREGAHTLALHGVPDVAVEVVVASEEQAAAEGEGHRCDAADDALVGVGGQLLVCPQVKQAAGGVVRARADGLSVGEELWMQGAWGQNSDLGSPRPLLPCPHSCPGGSRLSCFSRPLLSPSLASMVALHR